MHATNADRRTRSTKAHLLIAGAPPTPNPPGLDSWHLAAAEQLTAACKSVVLAAALLRGRLGAAEALEAARLEEAFQIEDWGMVEAGHDLDAADLATRVAAPAVMVGLLRRGGGSGGDGGGRG